MGDLVKLRHKDRLIEHRQYIDKYGQDIPEICNWKWDRAEAGKRS